MSQTVIESDSVESTERIGRELAVTLVGGECIALDGELGAGKTQFVRGLVQGLGGDGRQVSSPTFVLMHVYNGGVRSASSAQAMRLRLYHLDAYRVSGPDELEAIGFSELLGENGVVVVEWADRIKDLLPADAISVWIESTSPVRRRITVSRPAHPLAGECRPW